MSRDAPGNVVLGSLSCSEIHCVTCPRTWGTRRERGASQCWTGNVQVPRRDHQCNTGFTRDASCAASSASTQGVRPSFGCSSPVLLTSPLCDTGLSYVCSHAGGVQSQRLGPGIISAPLRGGGCLRPEGAPRRRGGGPRPAGPRGLKADPHYAALHHSCFRASSITVTRHRFKASRNSPEIFAISDDATWGLVHVGCVTC